MSSTDYKAYGRLLSSKNKTNYKKRIRTLTIPQFLSNFNKDIKHVDRRGIITTDLIFASIIILVIVSSVISVASERINAVSSTDKFGNARMTAEYVAGAINKVYTGGNGHAVTLSLPANISDESYVIRANSSGVFILIDGNTGKSSISHDKINGTFSMHGNQSYIIRNVRSWIVISKI